MSVNLTFGNTFGPMDFGKRAAKKRHHAEQFGRRWQTNLAFICIRCIFLAALVDPALC
jgi:hypothetical protein